MRSISPPAFADCPTLEPCASLDGDAHHIHSHSTLTPASPHQVTLDVDNLNIMSIPVNHLARVVIGAALGMLFVVGTKSYVEHSEDLTLGDNLTGLEAAKVTPAQHSRDPTLGGSVT